MPEKKKRINAVIDEDLYAKVMNAGYGITEAVTIGFTKLLEPVKENNGNGINQDILQERESRIKELQDHNEILIRELQELKTKGPENKEILQLQEFRITDLQDQLKVKDTQIEKLTETMQAQAVHLQTLLNQKAIEAPGSKKPWWQFW